MSNIVCIKILLIDYNPFFIVNVHRAISASTDSWIMFKGLYAYSLATQTLSLSTYNYDYLKYFNLISQDYWQKPIESSVV